MKYSAFFLSLALALAACAEPGGNGNGNDNGNDNGSIGGDIGDSTYCISGYKFYDASLGEADEDDLSGLAGIRIGLFDEAHAFIDATTTNEDGFYEFCGLEEGTYHVAEALPDTEDPLWLPVGELTREVALPYQPIGDETLAPAMIGAYDYLGKTRGKVSHRGKGKRRGKGSGNGELSPVFQCWVADAEGKPAAAYFGYDNGTGKAIKGSKVKQSIWPKGYASLLPTEFADGEFDAFGIEPWDGEKITWKLNGKSATATMEAEQCPEPEPEPQNAENINFRNVCFLTAGLDYRFTGKGPFLDLIFMGIEELNKTQEIDLLAHPLFVWVASEHLGVLKITTIKNLRDLMALDVDDVRVQLAVATANFVFNLVEKNFDGSTPMLFTESTLEIATAMDMFLKQYSSMLKWDFKQLGKAETLQAEAFLASIAAARELQGEACEISYNDASDDAG